MGTGIGLILLDCTEKDWKVIRYNTGGVDCGWDSLGRDRLQVVFSREVIWSFEFLKDSHVVVGKMNYEKDYLPQFCE